MVQILGHTLKNWLLIMHGWPYRKVTSQTKQCMGPLPFVA